DGKEIKKNGIFQPANKSALDHAYKTQRKHAGGNPRAARQLAKIEAKANKLGTSPRQLKNAKHQQEAKLLTILVEFNPNANDDFTGVLGPESTVESRLWMAVNIQNGPAHNNIPSPATSTHEVNNSMWVPDFSPAH